MRARRVFFAIRVSAEIRAGRVPTVAHYHLLCGDLPAGVPRGTKVTGCPATFLPAVIGDERDVPHCCMERRQSQEKPMKTIVSVLMAISVLTVIAGQASAWDPQKFWEQQSGGGG